MGRRAGALSGADRAHDAVTVLASLRSQGRWGFVQRPKLRYARSVALLDVCRVASICSRSRANSASRRPPRSRPAANARPHAGER